MKIIKATIQNIVHIILPPALIGFLIGCCPSYQVGTHTVTKDSLVTTPGYTIHDTVRVDNYYPGDTFIPDADTFDILQSKGILDVNGTDKKTGCSYKIFWNPAMHYFIIGITVPPRQNLVPFTVTNSETKITQPSFWKRIQEFCVDFFITIGILLVGYGALQIGKVGVKLAPLA